jgi:hypothetical protein
VIDTGVFKSGDMLGYFNVSPHGDYGQIRYTHSTMFAGKPDPADPADPGRITCHSMSRFPGLSDIEDRWFLKDGYTYTLIHFTSDDGVVSAATARVIAGWWKVAFTGDTLFYDFLSDGRVRMARAAPRQTRSPVPASAATADGHWFEDAGIVTLIWRQSGTVEVWTRDPGSGGFTIQRNNHLTGRADHL